MQDIKVLVVHSLPGVLVYSSGLPSFCSPGALGAGFSNTQDSSVSLADHSRKPYFQQKKTFYLTCDWTSGATPRSEWVNLEPRFRISEPENTSCHSLPSQSALSLAAPTLDSQACSTVQPHSSLQTRQLHTSAYTGFCSAHQQMSLCSHGSLKARWGWKHLLLSPCEKYLFWISFCTARRTSNTGVIALI